MKPLFQKLGNFNLPIYRSKWAGKVRYEVRWHDEAVQGSKFKIQGSTVRKKFSSRARAEAYAHEILTSLANGATSYLRLSPRERDYAERLRDLEKEHCSSLEGLLFARQGHWDAAQTQAATAGILISEAVAKFLAVKRAENQRPKTLRDLETRLNRFARDFNLPIGRLTAEMITDWLGGLRVNGQPASPRTRNNYRAVILALCKNTGVENIVTTRPAKTNTRKLIWTPAEMRLLIEGAGDRQLPVLVFGGFCGLRTESEIDRLNWEDVDFERGIVHIYDQTKTGDPRLVPMPEAALEFLLPWTGARGRVCSYPAGRVGDALGRLARRVGLGRWRHNSLRHSFGTYRVAVTDDLAKVSLEMGNSTLDLVTSYRRPRLKETGEEWFAIRPKNVTSGILNLKFR